MSSMRDSAECEYQDICEETWENVNGMTTNLAYIWVIQLKKLQAEFSMQSDERSGDCAHEKPKIARK